MCPKKPILNRSHELGQVNLTLCSEGGCVILWLKLLARLAVFLEELHHDGAVGVGSHELVEGLLGGRELDEGAVGFVLAGHAVHHSVAHGRLGQVLASAPAHEVVVCCGFRRQRLYDNNQAYLYAIVADYT